MKTRYKTIEQSNIIKSNSNKKLNNVDWRGKDKTKWIELSV